MEAVVFGYENVWCIVMSYLLVKGGISVSRRKEQE